MTEQKNTESKTESKKVLKTTLHNGSQVNNGSQVKSTTAKLSKADAAIQTEHSVVESLEPNASLQQASQSQEHSESVSFKVVDIVNLKQQDVVDQIEQVGSATQAQLQQVRDDVVARTQTLKQQLQHSQQHLQTLRTSLKAELGDLWRDMSKFGIELKSDISQLSLKHREQLTQTIKKSTADTLNVWGGKTKD